MTLECAFFFLKLSLTLAFNPANVCVLGNNKRLDCWNVLGSGHISLVLSHSFKGLRLCDCGAFEINRSSSLLCWSKTHTWMSRSDCKRTECVWQLITRLKAT